MINKISKPDSTISDMTSSLPEKKLEAPAKEKQPQDDPQQFFDAINEFQNSPSFNRKKNALEAFWKLIAQDRVITQ
jgi:hypothetical protein